MVRRDVPGGPQPISLQIFMSQKQVCEATNLSKTTVWRKQKDGDFPKPIKISANRVVWDQGELEKWQEAQMAKRPAAVPDTGPAKPETD